MRDGRLSGLGSLRSSKGSLSPDAASDRAKTECCNQVSSPRQGYGIGRDTGGAADRPYRAIDRSPQGSPEGSCLTSRFVENGRRQIESVEIPPQDRSKEISRRHCKPGSAKVVGFGSNPHIVHTTHERECELDRRAAIVRGGSPRAVSARAALICVGCRVVSANWMSEGICQLLALEGRR